jgi:hypothetical protein
MICPHCGKEHKEVISFCPVTGARLDMQRICTICGSDLEMDWLVCPQCGKPVENAGQPGASLKTSVKKKTKRYTYVGIAFILVFFIASGIYLTLNYFLPPSTPSTEVSRKSTEIPARDTPTVTPSPTITETSIPYDSTALETIPILGSFYFSMTPIPYPMGWPEEIRYPTSMILVAAKGSSEAGWISQHIFQGSVQDASIIIATFFVDNGWVVNDHIEVDKNNSGFFIARNNQEGLILVSWDPSTNQTKIAITVYD